ncbi:DUF4279 domain-containing protein [Geitlerinema sp. CS-897]|nr:DUF4279 domain-containing protein [Geitlerinema sp. CS-897]
MGIRFFDADGNEIVSPQRPVCEVVWIGELGGEFDETSVTLSVYSKTLDLDEVTELLGVQPTKAWNPGERHPVGNGRSRKTRIVEWGKWRLTSERNRKPVEPKIRKLLQQCTPDLKIWQMLASKYDIWLTIAAHLNNWNRELDLTPDILQLLSERHLMLKVDVYFDGDEDK